MTSIAGSGIWASSAGILVSRGAISARGNGVVADGVTDNGDRLRALAVSCASSGKILRLDEPGVINFSGGLDISSHFLEIYPNVTIVPTDTLDNRIQLAGANCGIIAGKGSQILKIRNRRYKLSAGSVTGNVATVTLKEDDLEDGSNPYVVGDSVQCFNTVGFTTSMDGVSKTITAIDGLNISFAHTSTDSELTVPYHRPDGWNMGDYAIYPTIQRTRTQSAHDSGVVVQASAERFHVEGLTIVGGASSGVFCNGASRGLFKDLHIKQPMADGIITVHGASGNRSENILIEEPGDDGFSLIGYRDPTGKQLSNLVLDGLIVRNQLAHGRGMTIEGVNGFVFSNVLIENVYGAAMMIARDTTSLTFSNRGVRGNNIILHTCGNNGSVPDGWTDGTYPSIYFSGNNQDFERNEDIILTNVVSINSRFHHVGDNDTEDANRAITIENFSSYGGANNVVNVLAPNQWVLRNWRMYHCGGQGGTTFSFGGSNALVGHVIQNLSFHHVNADSYKYLTDISCVDETITLTYRSAHGYSGTPVLTVVGVGSDYDSSPSSATRTGQMADEALNDTYAGGSISAWTATTSKAHANNVIPTTTNGFLYRAVVAGTTGGTEPTWPTTIGDTVVDGTVTWRCLCRHYTSISFPDTTTVVMEGTGKADSWLPRIYTYGGSPTPNAATYGTASSGTDIIKINTGTPVGSIDIDRVYLREQCRGFEQMLDEGSTFACLPFGEVVDKTGVGTSLSPGFTQRDKALNVVITAAQMLALNASPVTLLPAISTTWAYRVKQFEATLIYNSAAYSGVDAGDDLVLRYTNGSGNIVAAIEATGFLDQTSAQFRVVSPSSAVATAAVEQNPTANAAIILHMTGGEITSGNSTVRVRIVYDILRVSG
jgi:hypothetical protein